MTDIEIPYEKDRSFRYRLFEILPGASSWLVLFLPLILSIINVTLATVFVFMYVLIYLTRAFAISIRALQGYRIMRHHQGLNWPQLVKEVELGEVEDSVVCRRPRWHKNNLSRLQSNPAAIKPSALIHAIIVATYQESREVLEPTIQAILNSEYDTKQVIFVLAYEERGGAETAERAKSLVQQYKQRFYHAMAVEHPKDIPGEIIGKGGNVTFAGRKLQQYLQQQEIDPMRVVVTTLDADNRPDKMYLPALSYLYAVCPDPMHVSFQPIAMYTNNIWDAPAPMRVVATGNSFFHIANSQRPHLIANFSAHAQGMKPLIETNFWSVRTVVEDGHHFWRSYFRFQGKYRVLPLYVPIYQDAVLTDRYIKTLKAQFVQYRRWTWGASDIAFFADKGFFHKNKVPRYDLVRRFLRLYEGHVTWAVGPLISLYAGFVPALFHPQSYAANELPLILSRIQTFALPVVLAQFFICFKILPPKPARYKKHRSFFMVTQWVYMPFTGIIYNSFAALYSQTRLLLGKYLDKFDVTEKAVVNESGGRSTSD